MLTLLNRRKYVINNYLLKKVKNYISSRLIYILELGNNNLFSIEDVIISNYNINIVVNLNYEKYLLRINIEQQSGLLNQVEYEYKIHEYLSKYQITPKVYIIDTSKIWIPYDFFIEQYITGEHLNYDNLEFLQNAAKILAKLHDIPLPSPNFLIVWKNPLIDLLSELINMHASYKKRPTKNKKLVKYGNVLLEKLKTIAPLYEHEFKSGSIVHTDVVNDNFICTNDDVRIIDWEKPRIDDPSYDLCVFLGKPSQLWGAKRLMTENEKKIFLREYSKYRHHNIKKVVDKIKIMQPFVSFRWVLWAAHRKADVDEKIISEENYEFHKKNYYRYEKTAALDNVIEIIDNIDK